jgi:hypothetical protein
MTAASQKSARLTFVEHVAVSSWPALSFEL